MFRRWLFLLSVVTHFTLSFVSYGILCSESVYFICGFSLLWCRHLVIFRVWHCLACVHEGTWTLNIKGHISFFHLKKMYALYFFGKVGGIKTRCWSLIYAVLHAEEWQGGSVGLVSCCLLFWWNEDPKYYLTIFYSSLKNAHVISAQSNYAVQYLDFLSAIKLGRLDRTVAVRMADCRHWKRTWYKMHLFYSWQIGMMLIDSLKHIFYLLNIQFCNM